MELTVTTYQILINKRLDADEINNINKNIENTGIGGNIPRPIIPVRVFKNKTETVIAIIGNVGNYHDLILSNIENEFNVRAYFINDKHAQKIFDDIDENYFDYL